MEINFSNNDLGDKASTTALSGKVMYNGDPVNITLSLSGTTLTITTATPS